MVEYLTKAMKATHSPIPMKSIRAQWPVSTQTHTTWLRDCVNIVVFQIERNQTIPALKRSLSSLVQKIQAKKMPTQKDSNYGRSYSDIVRIMVIKRTILMSQLKKQYETESARFMSNYCQNYCALTPIETVTERSSARVNRPQRPREIFPLAEEHG